MYLLQNCFPIFVSKLVFLQTYSIYFNNDKGVIVNSKAADKNHDIKTVFFFSVPLFLYYHVFTYISALLSIMYATKYLQ